MKKYDLTVAYRIYPKVSKVPPVFSADKYNLADLCLNSFKKSLGSLKVKMFVLLDGCPPEYEELFLKHFDAGDLTFIKLNGVGNYATFGLQIKTLLEQNFSEIIYFAEDDYLYFPDQFVDMVQFLKENEDVDFVSPYDHLDYYNSKLHDLHNYPSFIKISNNKHWRTVGSTCLTFLTTKETLKKTKNVFLTFTEGNEDSSLWFNLTKYNMGKWDMLKISLKNPFLLQVLYKTVTRDKTQTTSNKQWKLWVPIPTIATHMENDYLSPTIDWDEFIKMRIDENSKDKITK